MTGFAPTLLALVLALACAAHGADRPVGRVALPAIKIEKAGACVAPTEEMRRNHMGMLQHQRDRTMRQGIREPRFSLKNCVECHAGRETGSVLGRDGFCASCHAYASVSIDCFECHSALRQARAAPQ